MFTELNQLGLLLLATILATALGFLRFRGYFKDFIRDVIAEVDATDDRVDALSERITALESLPAPPAVANVLKDHIIVSGGRADRLQRQIDALFAGVKTVQAQRDALDAYVQELPTFDDLAASEQGAANVLALRLRELADKIEADAGTEITQEDLEAGRVSFDDGTRLEDVIPGIFTASRLADDDLPGRHILAGGEFAPLRLTPAAVSPCACDPSAAECSAECLVVSPAGVSESIIGTAPAADPCCDDCTCAD